MEFEVFSTNENLRMQGQNCIRRCTKQHLSRRTTRSKKKMSYYFNAQSKGTKILLQSDRKDYITYDFFHLEHLGENMFFQQSSLFPSAYLNTALKGTETPFMDHVPDIGMQFLTYI